MRRAVAKNPKLEGYLVPRTILGWALNKSQYEGAIPGFENIYLDFKKSESGYEGSVGKNDAPVQPFIAENEYHLVAEVIQAMGYEFPGFDGSDKTLSFLGKSVDALIKAKVLTQRLGKVDLPGSTAKPQQQGAPEGPTPPTSASVGGKAKAPTVNVPNSPVGASSSGVDPKNGVRTKPKLPKLKMPVLKMEMADINKPCKTCAGVMFKSEVFTGCMCWRDLAKHATTVSYSDGVVVEFSSSADKAAVLALFREIQ